MQAISRDKAIYRPWRDNPWEYQGFTGKSIKEVYNKAYKQNHTHIWRVTWL